MKRSSSFALYFQYFIIVAGSCVIILSVLSLIHDLRYWYFKILDFPRLQYLILAIICLMLFLFMNRRWKFSAMFFILGLLASIYIHGSVVLPYYFGEKTVPDAIVEDISDEKSIKVLIANVLITNRNSEEFIQIVEDTKPDLILAMETDFWWEEQLEVLGESYAHTMEYPLKNAYGMMLYSKYPLENEEIMFLNQDDVPSFYAEVVVNNGKRFAFIGVHPVAPVPSDKYPDNVGEEEVALIKVGKLAAQRNLPLIVAGDFNDVSWSRTSRLFEDEGDLKNVRIGRGIYSSFDAQSLIFRWPLDHFFVSEEFSLVEMERLPKFGSDHFPMIAEFFLSEN